MAAPSKQSRAEPAWRKWYKLERWRQLKLQTHLRDSYICQRTGVLCDGVYPAGNSPVADHIREHRGDPALFWDPDNVHTVSKAYHDAEKQKLEQATLHQRGTWD
jgi:5-methylcytosine-specific restriction endonuclease McrA